MKKEYKRPHIYPKFAVDEPVYLAGDIQEKSPKPQEVYEIQIHVRRYHEFDEAEDVYYCFGEYGTSWTDNHRVWHQQKALLSVDEFNALRETLKEINGGSQ